MNLNLHSGGADDEFAMVVKDGNISSNIVMVSSAV
jgi:hypothetical protein